MRFILFLSMVAALGGSGRAATFTIDPAESTVALSGTISTAVGIITFTEQGPGSLGTRLEGTLQIEVGGGEVTLSGGTIDARTNGVWRPAPGGGDGSAMADFGAQGTSPLLGTVLGALRNINLVASSPSQPLQGSQFDAAEITFAFPAESISALDYSAGFAGTGTRLLAGAATNRTATVGTITGTAGAQIATIAVDATFVFSVLSENDTSLRVRGQILAREGGIDPQPEGPRFTAIEIVDNQARMTVDGTVAATRLQSSTNLTSWADKQAEVAVVDGDTRVFTVPVAGPKEFYQVVQ
jgi:hypothetical protein